MLYTCKYCKYTGLRSQFEVDHVVPASRSPLYLLLNPILELICSGCNRQKGAKTPAEYLTWRLLNWSVANYGPIVAR